MTDVVAKKKVNLNCADPFKLQDNPLFKMKNLDTL